MVGLSLSFASCATCVAKGLICEEGFSKLLVFDLLILLRTVERGVDGNLTVVTECIKRCAGGIARDFWGSSGRVAKISRITFGSGCLGSCIDEERSKLR